MRKKLLQRWLPGREKLHGNAFIRRFAHWFADPRLWHVNRRSFARSVAAGMLAGLIPGPLQVLTAASLALFLRSNLPIAIVTTLYSNPLTIGPLYWLAYRLGRFVLPENGRAEFSGLPAWQDHGVLEWPSLLAKWLLQLGWPLAVGLPLLALMLALFGYFLADWGWKIHVYLAIRKRACRHQTSKTLH